ncbi:MAG: flagellar assembly peptidoglycan hydrolase FlgJ [Acidovorax sp.]
MAYTSTASLSSGSNAVQSNALVADGRSLNALKLQAGKNDPQAAREAAKQFESLFMREMIKSMREATMKSGLLDGAEGNLASDMLDQQLAVQMSGRPGGLSEAIQRQLAQQMGGAQSPQISAPSTLSMGSVGVRGFTKSAAADGSAQKPEKSAVGRDAFVQQHSAAAERVARDSGIPAAFMLGQAGHETGWGRGVIRTAGGGNSFNLFGIKADKNWTGKVAQVATTEYVNGQPRRVTAKFRAYDSYEDSFRDYARLINDNPRYEKARAKTGSALAYATELQKAGYATDPEYANKLSRAINSTLHVARAAPALQAAVAAPLAVARN